MRAKTPVGLVEGGTRRLRGEDFLVGLEELGAAGR
jgi:hypothetical protein